MKTTGIIEDYSCYLLIVCQMFTPLCTIYLDRYTRKTFNFKTSR